MCVCWSLSRVRLFATPQTVARQAPLSRGFSRHEYWSGLPFPSPGDLPDSRIEPRSPALQSDSLPTELQGKPASGGEEGNPPQAKQPLAWPLLGWWSLSSLVRSFFQEGERAGASPGLELSLERAWSGAPYLVRGPLDREH